MDSFENIVDDVAKLRADAIERFLKANGITEADDDWTISSTYNEDGSETINLWHLERVGSLNLSFSVRVNNTKATKAKANDSKAEDGE